MSPSALPEGDSLDDVPFFGPTKPPKKALAPHFEGLDSFARLIDKKRASHDLAAFKLKVVALPACDTATLIARLGTTSDALMAWAICCQLEKRGVPPCLRWPGNTETPQMLFVNWCADIAWFVKHNPTHTPRFKSWQRLFKYEPFSPQWLETAFWHFVSMHARSLAYVTGKALALTDDHRQELLTVPTLAMVAARREIAPERIEQLRADLLTHANNFPDKSGKLNPSDVAARRALLYRAHVLLGKHPPTTAKHWPALTGQTISRQAIGAQLSTIERALRIVKFGWN